MGPLGTDASLWMLGESGRLACERRGIGVDGHCWYVDE